MDQIIRRRLMTDGEGAGDERRLNLLHKQIIRWVNSLESEKSQTFKNSAFGLADHMEYALTKTQRVFEVCHKESDHYKEMYKDFDSKLALAQESILDCKKELERAKRVRKHRQEYDAMANLIEKHPDRKHSMQQIEELEMKKTEENEELERLEQKLGLRKKQLHVLLLALQQIQRQLEDEEENAEDDSESQASKEEEKMEEC